MDLKPVPQNYEYTPGDGQIKVEKKPKYWSFVFTC
jgi:hypothetical protein